MHRLAGNFSRVTPYTHPKAYTLTGNQITGFDEPGCAALVLGPDKLGKPLSNLYRSNRISRCAVGVVESMPGLWEAAVREGNVFTDCGGKLPER